MFGWVLYAWLLMDYYSLLQKACHSDNFFFNSECLIKKNTIFASLFKNRYCEREFLGGCFLRS